MSSDTDYRFFADRNFYYLTGLENPGYVLLIEKDDDNVRTTLYAPARDSMKERWHGKRMDFADIAAVSGVSVADICDLEKCEEKEFELIKNENVTIYLDNSSVMEKPFELKNQIEKNGRKVSDLSEITTQMRLVKQPCEYEAIGQAAKITEDAIDEMKTLIRPGVSEYELYTKLEYEMARRSTMNFAFETIVSCGRMHFISTILTLRKTETASHRKDL